jgi:hypothetical protein
VERHVASTSLSEVEFTALVKAFTKVDAERGKLSKLISGYFNFKNQNTKNATNKVVFKL